MPGEVAKLFVVFVKTLQYSYLFGILPALMIGAVDDILFHVRRIGWVVRMLIVGVIAFRRGGIALRLARAGQRRHPVRAVWPGRLRPGDGLVVAGASGRDARCRPDDWLFAGSGTLPQ